MGRPQDVFLVRARENLAAARLLNERGLYNAAASRAYYDAFQAALAALDRHGLYREEMGHDRVQAQFSGELVNRRKVVPSDLRSTLSDLQSVRNDADYGTRGVSQKVVGRQLRKDEAFVREVRQALGADG